LETEKENKPKKSFKLFIIGGIVLLVLVLGGVAAFFFLFSSSGDSSLLDKGKGTGGKKPAETAQGVMHKMDPFLVNLADPGQLRYLKATLHIETHQKGEEYEKRLPQLRDLVLTVLSSKNYRDIMTSEGKNALREEIKGKMNQLLAETKVKNIYFTEFVIQ
jgi:flagellar FliL protein